MNLQNYYYYFKNALTPRFCDEIIKRGKKEQEQIALIGNKDIKKASDPKEYLEDFVFFLINWKTFCELCKSNNVKLIFSTWDPIDSENLKPGPFDEFFELERNKTEKYFDEYYQTHEVKKDDHKKRDGHSGRILHSFYAEEFYEQYKKRGYCVK
jgi:hypothetical protein